MAVSYKKLWYLLVDKKMSKAALERKAGITHYSMNKKALMIIHHQDINRLIQFDTV